MPPGRKSLGVCLYCGQELGKNGVVHHLKNCAPRQTALEQAARTDTPPEQLHHLRLQSSAQQDFWLDVEMRGSAPLQELDAFLRAIWLDCCDHPSKFTMGDVPSREIVHDPLGSLVIPKNRKVASILGPQVQMLHVYDFATPTTTIVRGLAVRTGKPTTDRPLVLMIRNAEPPGGVNSPRQGVCRYHGPADPPY